MLEQPLLSFTKCTELPISPVPLCTTCGTRPARRGKSACNTCSRGKNADKRTCSVCRQEHRRRGHFSNSVTYCSSACLLLYNAAWRENLKLSKPKPALPHCEDCGKELKSRNSKHRFCTPCGRVQKTKETAERQATPRICVLCGLPWKQKKTSQGKYCKDCRQISDRILKFGVEWEPVNPLTVFEHDSWRCGSCGIATPKELVGSIAEPNAPTLEHIYPVSLGGAHSYKNCGLSCRACNSKKRNKIELEPRLKGVADFTPYKRAQFTALKINRKQILCACGCGEYFVPSTRNRTGCKHGHWYRTEAGLRLIYEMSGAAHRALSEAGMAEHYTRRPYVPMAVEQDSRLGKKLQAMRQRQHAAAERAARPRAKQAPRRAPRLATELRSAAHTAFGRSGLSVLEYVKASLTVRP